MRRRRAWPQGLCDNRSDNMLESTESVQGVHHGRGGVAHAPARSADRRSLDAARPLQATSGRRLAPRRLVVLPLQALAGKARAVWEDLAVPLAQVPERLARVDPTLPERQDELVL